MSDPKIRDDIEAQAKGQQGVDDLAKKVHDLGDAPTRARPPTGVSS